MTSKLFKEPIRLKTLAGKGVYVTLTMPRDKACNYMRPLYVTMQFDGQPVSRILVDNGAILNILLVSMLRKVGKKKHDILPINLIMTNFYGTVA